MTEFHQIECPEDRSQQVVQTEEDSLGVRSVSWCSRKVGHPDCDQDCLGKFNKLCYVMLADVPLFQLKELARISQDAAVQRFKGTGLGKLPVLDGKILMGGIQLIDIADWKENTLAQDWSSFKERSLADEVKTEQEYLSPQDTWATAKSRMLKSHSNELFVVDEAGRFSGLIYARQLLRRGTK